ncbi:ras-related protein Rab-24-like isoform X2 [Macrobrachium rosenbergii]|uniref:ras-related protein Rab-24-like isoform X2 n=1 Tax=Macrobrachium rosenbergii TaxID=79674 RepID=UPI0034D665C9
MYRMQIPGTSRTHFNLVKMSGMVDMKVVVLGQISCGKTSLVERFIYNRFNENYQSTIGAAFGARYMNIEGRKICLGLWDTAGSERYEAMSRIYYRDAKAAVICYDITNIKSVDRAKFWVGEVQKHEENCKLYLCGTKLDLVKEDPQRREVDYHDLNDYAEEINGKLFETSSKTNTNIEELFACIVEDYAKDNAAVIATLERQTVDLTDEEKKNKCC